jgi:hypothetical protein
MAHVDMEQIKALWERTSEEFARQAKAIGSILFSGTTLSWSSASGDLAGSVDLAGTFATNDYVLSNAIMSAGIDYEASTGLITIHFYNGRAVEVDSVSFTVS